MFIIPILAMGELKLILFGASLFFSVYLRDWRMLLTPNFTPDTRILFRRNITERLGAIAPFFYIMIEIHT